VAVDGERVDADRDLSFHILPHRPGDQIVLSVVRDGSEREVTVELGTLPETN
jgi:S1-C subfamily serine protease